MTRTFQKIKKVRDYGLTRNFSKHRAAKLSRSLASRHAAVVTKALGGFGPMAPSRGSLLLERKHLTAVSSRSSMEQLWSIWREKNCLRGNPSDGWTGTYGFL